MPDDVTSSPSSHLRRRDHAQRARVQAMSHRERLAAMQRLIDDAWATLLANPAGIAHFRRRNFRARSIRRTPELPSNGT
jgi:hypothetical protein